MSQPRRTDPRLQVCNSWIYVVDEVLLPAWDVDGVPTVTLPDTSNLFPTTPSPSPSPGPEQPAPEPEPEVCCKRRLHAGSTLCLPGSGSHCAGELVLPRCGCLPAAGPSAHSHAPLPVRSWPPQAPGGCNVTWQEVAKEQQGLSLLAGVLGQEQVASALPGPGEANTLFAPTDAAFFNMLATLSECVGGGRAGACWPC